MSQPENLVDALALERLEVNLFRGLSPNEGPGRIFGGQVIAQSLLAAYGTARELSLDGDLLMLDTASVLDQTSREDRILLFE